MPVERSPLKDPNSTMNVEAKIDNLLTTMIDQFTQVKQANEAINGSIKQLQESVNQLKTTQDTILNRLSAVEDIATNLTGVQEGVQNQLKLIDNEAKEQYQKLVRMSNIVLMGIPETDAGLLLANQLLALLHSEWKGPVIDRRIGEKKSSQNQPRPLRVPVKHSLMRDEIIGHCSSLKGKDEYKGISVRRDLTKKEQQEWKAQGEVRRSQRKRKGATDPSQGSSDQKRNKTNNEENMEI